MEGIPIEGILIGALPMEAGGYGCWWPPSVDFQGFLQTVFL